MSYTSTFFTALTLATAALPAVADVVSGTGVPYYSPSGWKEVVLAQVGLQGRVEFESFTAKATVRDQGWGGVDPYNAVTAGVYADGVELFRGGSLGSGRANNTDNPSFYNPVWTASAAELGLLNDAIDQLDWSVPHNLDIRLVARTVGWPGWSLRVQSSDFQATVNSVPEPASLALVGLALVAASARPKRHAVRLN